MADCTDYPTPEDAKRFKNNAGSVDEFVTSDSDTFVDQDGGEHITIDGIEQLAETQRSDIQQRSDTQYSDIQQRSDTQYSDIQQRSDTQYNDIQDRSDQQHQDIQDRSDQQHQDIDQLASDQRDAIESTFSAQFAYMRIGNISDYAGSTLTEPEKLNAYQYPDDSGNWYGAIQGQTFPVPIPPNPSTDNGWALVNQRPTYQGLWPDTGGSAYKGDTYQTQVSGTPTGQYFTALQDTSVDPVGDDVNWRKVISGQSLGGLTNYQATSVANAIDGNGQAESKMLTVGGDLVPLALNQTIAVDDYYGGANPSNSGVLFFKVVAAGTGTADGGKHIDVPGGIFQLQQNMKLPVSVKAYGARAGIDSTTNFENAINLYRSVFAPADAYKVNLRLPCSRLNIKGESKHVTSLEAFDKTKPTITALQGNVWTGATIEQVSIYGGGEAIDGTSCFRFGDLPYVSGQEFSGGMRFVDVNFYEAYACIWKPYGNIGNYFEKCSFYAAKYHYLNHKESATSEYMQQGNDTFKKCHFSYADVCSIYIDSYDGSTGFSTIHFEDCIQEANKGVDFYCRTTKGEYETQQTNLVFSNHHLEYSTKNSQVIVRGDARRITEWVDDDGISDGRGVPAYHLDGVTAMSMSSSNLVRAKLLNSIIQTSNGSSQTKINIADDLSYIDINDPSQKGYTADNYVDSIYAITRATSDPATLATKPRLEKSSDQRGLRGGETFDINPVQFGSITSSKVRDGVIFGSCQEVEFTAGTHQFTGFASANTDVSTYHIVTLDIKKISDNDADSISISGDNFFLARDLQDITKDRKGVWRSCAGMVRSTGDYQQQPLKVSVVASSNCTYRFSALQVLSFTKISEAYEFLSKGVYALPKGQGLYPIITYGTTPPTTGYWERGDTVIDATPSSGSPIGWKCTAAGEPGVWVPMAVL
ncbi:hypothetical protein VP142E351_P0017 [Vibrio phage 142E35-1]|nr:hypothetical protein VP142E351_P0017 [Vibrio phage 142E35-1]